MGDRQGRRSRGEQWGRVPQNFGWGDRNVVCPLTFGQAPS